MNSFAPTINDSLQEILDKRKEEFLYRFLQVNEGMIDFCSNDYLGFARSESVKQQVQQYAGEWAPLSGATGSRSISGNSSYAEELERFIASYHHAEAALLFNSGYDANVGLFSCIAKKEDILICDELIHASIIDGCRLSYARRFKFAHNDPRDLEKKLKQANLDRAPKSAIFVAVESIYSMDGDAAPLPEMAMLCLDNNANLIVDEAHATGVFGPRGRGMVNQLGLESAVFARVHTFGKAIGSHGAAVLGSTTLRNYLVNFARSFIFTTALPAHSLITTRAAYEVLNHFDNTYLHCLVQQFKLNFQPAPDAYLIESNSPIQSLVMPGNERARNASRKLQSKGFDVRAITSPSVPPGKERLRISLHMHNTMEQVDQLKSALQEIL